MLNFHEYGAEHKSGPDHPPLVIAHGLFGSARNWGVIAKRLADKRHVVVADMRNHGESPFYDDHQYSDLATDLGELIRSLGGRADILGHSMGGKSAMTLALQAPELLRRLIVADIAPVAYGHTQMPLIDAMEALDLTRIASRQAASEALAAGVPEDGVRAFLLQSLDLRSDPVRWRLNHTALRANMADILSFPPIGGEFTNPTLFLTGAESDYVGREHRDTIKALFPRARFAKLPGAGHWLHADKPREFEAAVRVFLDA